MKLMFIPLLFFSLNATAKSCLVKKAAIDIGSGTTKFLAAEIDQCKNKIGKILYDEKVATAFNENLEKSSTHQIDPEFADQQIEKMLPHIQNIQKLKIKLINAVGTSAFRMAVNGQSIMQNIAKKLRIQAKVIDQKTEAKLGYLSAVVSSNLDPNEQILVWDIGGGSMQMIQKNKNDFDFYIGQLASVSYKNMLIEVLMNKDISTTNSPNPMKQIEKQSVKLAESYARIHIPPQIKDKISQVKVIGVGGVISQSIANQVNKKDIIRREDIESTFAQKVSLSDDQLTGEYRSTDVSNLALVLGFMRALKIESIQITKASLAQGLLFQ